ncbi:MAG: site-specific integrase [Rectinemataceae bacterium]|nr:site-specific integrase [Rectinemataceae bacterium]
METGAHRTTLDSLSEELISYYKQRDFSPHHIKRFRRHVEQIRKFNTDNGFSTYSAVECEQFIRAIIGEGNYSHLSRDEKDTIRCANVLIEYHLTGMISYRTAGTRELFHGKIGAGIKAYLEYCTSRGYSSNTISDNKIYLGRFQKYLDAVGRLDFSELLPADILGFIKVLCYSTKATIHCTLCSLRGLLRYLERDRILAVKWSPLVPKDNYRKEAKLPTTYTEDEIERMLSAVDRGSPKGKRDYAMLLLACRLGLRASDICGLSFDNLLWRENSIVLTQEKTKKRIELPLLAEVGNAIIDYLKYGRPVSSLPYVFLHASHEYRRLAEPTLHSIVGFYLRRAGVANVEKKKHGPHALRHSLAGFLLQKKTPLPVISEVLGHSCSETTRTYLRIDMEQLRMCILKVPPVEESYYLRDGVARHG